MFPGAGLSVRQERRHGTGEERRQDEQAALKIGDDALVQSQYLFQLLAICSTAEDDVLRRATAAAAGAS
jgi:hypothetical protein